MRIGQGVRRLGLALALLGAACEKKDAPPGDPANDAAAPPSPAAVAGQAIFVGKCAACHTIGEGDRTGPDLKDVAKRRDHDWLVKWLKNPVAMGDSDHIGKEISDKYGNVIMPDPHLADGQIEEVIAFVTDASKRGGFKLPERKARTLEGAELEKAKNIFFDRCAGCHGSLRQGAVGPKLTPERTKEIGMPRLMATLNHGRPGGMPNWGELGILSTADVELLADYLEMPPAPRPELSLADAKKSWISKLPPAARPKSPPAGRNFENTFAVLLADPGSVAIIDGDTKERLSVLEVGFAVHTLKSSASGRYLYALNRDGRISAIDLWVEPPTVVAQARGCYDARNIESSRAKTHVDKLLVEGCYWPPQLVVFDGATLEPKQVVSVLPPPDAPKRLDEVRVGAIVAPANAPLFAAGLMESGEVALLDYAKPGFPVVARIAVAPELVDGGLDPSGRYFVLSVQNKNELAVVDLVDKKLVTTIATGKNPHPDPLTSWDDPELGPVAATPHLGEGKLAIFGADPKNHASSAWKVLRQVTDVPGGGLTALTHGKSPWVWLDSPVNPKADLTRQVCVASKKTGKLEKCIHIADRGRVLGFAYNQSGSEVWMSVWDKRGAIVVFDDVSLKETKRIEADWVVTPTKIVNASANVAP